MAHTGGRRSTLRGAGPVIVFLFPFSHLVWSWAALVVAGHALHISNGRASGLQRVAVALVVLFTTVAAQAVPASESLWLRRRGTTKSIWWGCPGDLRRTDGGAG